MSTAEVYANGGMQSAPVKNARTVFSETGCPVQSMN